eukprot:SAG25_NODE_275_length_10545_cov_4.715968_10_plen_33_part_00
MIQECSMHYALEYADWSETTSLFYLAARDTRP